MSNQARSHVLVWVDKTFIESEGMLHILRETGVLVTKNADWEKVVEAAENSGGFALSGTLMDEHHGAGIWIKPEGDSGLEIMIPWGAVRSVVTATEPTSTKIFSLVNVLSGRKGSSKS
jgi:hypothetical protein